MSARGIKLVLVFPPTLSDKERLKIIIKLGKLAKTLAEQGGAYSFGTADLRSLRLVGHR